MTTKDHIDIILDTDILPGYVKEIYDEEYTDYMDVYEHIQPYDDANRIRVASLDLCEGIVFFILCAVFFILGLIFGYMVVD